MNGSSVVKGKQAPRATSLPESDSQNEQTEKSLIGSLIFDPDRFDEVSDQVAADEFHNSGCRILFEAIGKMRSEGIAIDGVTLHDRLVADGLLEDAGGDDFIIECAETVPHAAHAAHYAKLVREKALRRFTAWRCSEGILEARDETQEIETTIGKIETNLHAVLERRNAAANTSIKEILLDAMDLIGKGVQFGISTGFDDLDKLTNGWQPGSVYILAARPSVGKTALAIKFLMNAGRDGVPAAMFSLEQSRLEVGERILSMESHIPVMKMRQKNLGEDICDQLMMNAGIVSDWPIEIDDTSDRTITSIGAVARLLQRRRGTRLFVLDYLQLVQPIDRKQPREQQVAEVSRGLKLLARQLKVSIICLAQLNRQVETRAEKKPVLSDLRESGSIEQDADIVMMIDRPGSYDECSDKTQATLCVRKNRNGSTGELPLYWDGPTMEFKTGVSSSTYYPEMQHEEGRDWTR